MRRAHGTAVSTQASPGRPRPEPEPQSNDSRTEESGSGAARGGGAQRSPPRRRRRRRSSSGDSSSSSSVVTPLLSLERRGVFETRTVFHFPYRRSSSGYFSGEGDSQPGSPAPPRAVACTQTPSPSAQALLHALGRVAEEARDRGARTLHGSSAGAGDVAEAMQAVEIGQVLRRIGDDYNDYILRGAERRRAAERRNQPPLPRVPQDPAFLICVGVLFVVLVWYFGADPDGQPDRPQGIVPLKTL
ncbi:uncharacterized protein LOC133509778 [Syngnathoides biaculeatus]|uniref:uncharacterized protein LOC133509778 n=1 Tax=Syngnathoides biaculeatus TaxID=300417 RepID=UPI002ADDE3D0|nr:uncharacterized protein LOC133509778 [Syngnathoides biaculeatus]